MQRASKMFTTEDRRRITRAVADAESKTAAEIVPIVATESDRYDRAEDTVGVLAGIFAMAIAWQLFQGEDPARGGWDGLSLALPLPMLVLILLAGVVIGTVVAARVAWLRRLFANPRHREAAVDGRAAQLFSDRRIHHAPSESGVLVYVSLFERRAAILADRTAFDVLGQERLDALCDWLTGDLKRGDVTGSLCTIVERLGDALADDLPRSDADANELDDALITIG
jgi:putative membrane protein